MATLTLILALIISSPVFAKNVDIKAPDGFVLKGAFNKPDPKHPTLILLHGWQSSKEEWDPLIKKLQKEGFGTLAYDSRTQGPRGRFVDDVGAALRYLEKEGIPRETISLAGASLGANVILQYAALTDFSGALICLSPGLDYQGLKTESVVGKIKTPILVVASPDDQYSYVSSLRLSNVNPSIKFWSDVKSGHGVQMFDDKLLERLLRWLKQH